MDSQPREPNGDRPTVVVSGESARDERGGLLVAGSAGARVVDHLDSGALVASDGTLTRELIDRQAGHRWSVEYSTSGIEAIHRLQEGSGDGPSDDADPELTIRGNEVISRAETPPRTIAAFDGVPRAIAATDGRLYVAVERDDSTGPATFLEGFDVATGKALLDVPLPFGCVNAIACVTRELAEAVASPGAANPPRTAEAAQHAMFERAGIDDPLRLWASGDPLPPEACRVRMRCAVPGQLEAGATVRLEVEIENAAIAILASGPPYPVMLTTRWFDERGREAVDTPTPEASLDPALTPGATKILPLQLVAPSDPGRYEVRVTLVQHWRAWFDEVDLANCVSAQVEVGGGPSLAVAESGDGERGPA